MIGTVKGIGGSAWIPHVGYVWKSADPTSPAELYQGTTWAKIKDRTILAAGDTYTTGATGGSATHTLTVDEIPSHSHTGSTSSAGAHTHTVYSGRTELYGGGEYGSYYPYSGDSTTSSAGTHTHTVTVGSTGSSNAFSIMMPYVVRYMWERSG